jgi:hypothetical protein
MQSRTSAVIAKLLLSLVCAPAFAAPAPAFASTAHVGGRHPDERDERVERWRADLQQLATELPKLHLDLFFAQPREEWEAKVADLDAQLDGLEEHEIVVEFMRLVASVGDGHTAVQWWQGPVQRRSFPIQVHPFAGELRVVQAPRDLAWSLGAKVTAIGGRPIDEAWQRVAEIVPHDNDAAVAANAPLYLETTWIAHALGLGHDRDHATFTVMTEAGEEKALDVGPNGPGMGPQFGAEPKVEPLWRQRRGEAYWFTIVPEQKLLYLQYNRCAEDPKRPFAELVAELAKAADAETIETFLIDLRHNGGGNSLVLHPLYRAIGASKALRAKGHLFAAIGENTFSSAMINAVELKKGWNALLVGGPTGGKPKSYGEIKYLELAHSKLKVSYSTKLFALLADDAPSVMPDLEAPVTWAHWKEGRDPALEAIARWREEAK